MDPNNKREVQCSVIWKRMAHYITLSISVDCGTLLVPRFEKNISRNFQEGILKLNVWISNLNLGQYNINLENITLI